jgi:hypothetical protein
MPVSYLAIVVVCLSLCGWSAPASADEKTDTGSETRAMFPEWREGMCCGPNALFAFLKCHNIDCTYSEIRERVSISTRGCSLADLFGAAKSFGAEVEIVKTDLDYLADGHLPAIVLLDGIGVEEVGHFSLLLRKQEGSVLLFDPIKCVITDLKSGQFQRIWSGYSLVATRIGTSELFSWGWISFLTVGVIFLATSFWFGKLGKGPCLAACIAALAASGCNQRGSESLNDASQIDDSRVDYKPQAPVRLKGYPCSLVDSLPATSISEAIALCQVSEELPLGSMLHLVRFEHYEIGRDPIPTCTNKLAADFLYRLLDHQAFRQAYGDREPLLVSTKYGARFSEVSWAPLAREIYTREPHVGQILSVLAELGVPQDTPIRTAHRDAHLRDVLDDCAANFSLDVQSEWVLEALMLYRPDQPTWKNKFGHTFSYDGLLTRLMDSPIGKGSCQGTHTLYDCAIALQLLEAHPNMLPSPTRDRIERYLQRASDSLTKNQESDGSWLNHWAMTDLTEVASHPDAILLARPRNEAIWITGHHLEWIALTPPRLRVSDERITAAASFIARVISMIPHSDIAKEPCYYTHGPHALRLLWRTADVQ